MPDEEIGFDEAVELVETWLRNATGGVERLSASATERAGRERVRGWRVTINPGKGLRRLDITIEESFPFAAPRIVLVDRPPFLTWAHVERDGRLCLATEAVTYSPRDPVGALANILHMAATLVAKCESGDNDEDFRSEALSYWDWAADYAGPPVVTICDADGPSRMIRAWWGAEFAILGDDEKEIEAWLRNRYGKAPPRRRGIADAVLIRLERCLVPLEYPRTAADVRALAHAAGASQLLDEALASIPDKLALILAMESVNGPALAGVVVHRPKPRRGADKLTKGFSGGRRIPIAILSPRYFGHDSASKVTLDRADAAWVHGRGQDERFSTLRKAKVVVLGCGSVGAPIAVALAQAGVGSLALIDHDLFKAANASRHPLGLRSARHRKAEALRRKIASDLPHLKVDAKTVRAEDVIHGPSGLLEDADLIVSAMGNWAAERLLDEWHRAESRATPILYAWTEPRACAGHAVTVFGTHSSLQLHTDDTGLPHLRVVQWSREPTRCQEPACGAVFEPYGPVELGHVTAMASQLALDTLLGHAPEPTHRVWACGRAFLERAGGAWTPSWRALPGFREEGAFIADVPQRSAMTDRERAA